MTEGWPHVQLGNLLSKVRRGAAHERRAESHYSQGRTGTRRACTPQEEQKHGRDIRANTLYPVGR